ncbi:Serine hydroxymethyltransferase [bacterium AB1]|nr:Serine hydroxymethyltransferase [bacterium AB1]
MYNRGLMYVDLIPSNSFMCPKIYKNISKNFVTIFNVYFEGYVKKRYYEGCNNIDQIEFEYINNVKKLFGFYYANIQPLSGYIANVSIYNAVRKYLKLKTINILSLDVNHGGHISHDIKSNKEHYNFIHYTYNPESDNINYDEINSILKTSNIHLVVTGYSAGSYIINFDLINKMCKKFNALHLADISHISGLICAKLYPFNANDCDICMTTTHKSLRGYKGAIIFSNRHDISKAIDRSLFPNTQAGASYQSLLYNSYIAKHYWGSEEFNDYMKKVLYIKDIFVNKIQKKYKIIGLNHNNHMLLIDFYEYNINSQIIAKNLYRANIVTNYNTTYKDSSFNESTGLRIGFVNLASYNYPDTLIEELIDNILNIINDTINDVFEDKVQHYIDITKKFLDFQSTLFN